MSSSRPLKSLRFSAAFFFLLLAACTLSAQQNNSPKPFSKDDLVKLLKGNVPSKRVGELAEERGIDFAVTPETEADLRRAGADDALLAALHSIVPRAAGAASSQPATLLITSTPGGARVYVDDEPVGTTSSQGRLKLSTLAPGAHHLRLSLDGYLDQEKDIEIIPGQTTNADLSLSTKASSAPDPPPARDDPAKATVVLIINSIPGGAKVYVDDELTGTTSPEGRLRISTLAPGKHKVRLSQGGYADREQDAELLSGQTTKLDVTLVAAASSDKALDRSFSGTAAQPGQTSTTSEPLVFEVLHRHYSQWANDVYDSVEGTLTVSAGALEFHEHGHHANAKHDFKISCIDILKVSADSATLVLNLQKGSWYQLDGSIDWHDNTRKAAPVLHAIQQACGRQSP